MGMDRRLFLALAAAGATGLSQFEIDTASATNQRHRIIYGLPSSQTRRFALTIDDGISPGSIAGYTASALNEPGLKYTYFVTSSYSSWRRNKPALSELIARGQVQLANHTRNHPDLRTLSNHQIEHALMDCHNYLEDEFGVNAMPFWRPPYGYYNWRVLKVAADLGYTAPTMWYGSLGTDSKNLTRTRLRKMATTWIQDGSVVIDHANNIFAANNFDIIRSAISSKNLSMVTLREAYPNY